MCIQGKTNDIQVKMDQIHKTHGVPWKIYYKRAKTKGANIEKKK